MTRQRLLASLLVMVLLAVAGIAAPVASNTSPILGLDLQGGFSVVLEAKEVDGVLPSEDTVEQAKEIIRQRVDGLGVAEPDITRQGRTVIVQLPGVRDRERAEELVGCTARLEFRPVVSRGGLGGPGGLEGLEGLTPEELENLTPEDLEDLGIEGLVPDDGAEPDPGDGPDTDAGETGQGMVGVAPGEGALPAQLAPTTTTTEPPAPETVPEPAPEPEPETPEAPTDTTEVPDVTEPDTDAAPITEGAGESASCVAGDGTGGEPVPLDQPGQFPDEDGLVYELGPAGFTGEALSRADATLGQTGVDWQVSADVRGEDRAQANEAFNACFQGDATCPPGPDGRGAIAIVLDGIVLSAPAVNAANLASDTFIITGDFDEGEAKDLALVLRYGSLPVEFDQAAQQQVSASLGADSLRAGLIAGLIGLAVLALYMVLYYRGFGLVVVASLLVWSGLMYGLINFLSATQGLALTLAGITGIIVSIGTTVDTYVVIFERVKDEVRGGRSVKIATERGYQRGIRTVLTANAAAFIGAFLLWYLTVGPVRGFAYFLGLSVILDLVVAILFTRPLMLLLSRSPRFADARFFGVATAAGTAEPKAVVS